MKYTVLALAAMFATVLADGAAPTTTRSVEAEKPATLNEIHPDLGTGALSYAVLAKLPDGVLLQSGQLQITGQELDAGIAKAPKEIQEQLNKNAFFVLEGLATEKLLVFEAKARLAETKESPQDKTDQEIVGEYLKRRTADHKVSDGEITAFYQENEEMFGGADLAQIKPQLEQYLLQQKRQDAVMQWIAVLGKRHDIRLASTWVKEQAVLAKDNPVDKARGSGKPSLVDFGSKGCRPCDMLAPILDTLREKYVGKANVLFVSVQQEQILASRYGIQAIPVQIFFDKAGKEVFRHVGFFPQDQIEKKLAEIGVK